MALAEIVLWSAKSMDCRESCRPSWYDTVQTVLIVDWPPTFPERVEAVPAIAVTKSPSVLPNGPICHFIPANPEMMSSVRRKLNVRWMDCHFFFSFELVLLKWGPRKAVWRATAEVDSVATKNLLLPAVLLCKIVLRWS